MARFISVYLLDGGFASQLERNGHHIPETNSIWSSIYLITDPKSVVEVHKQFIAAGSDIITTNTYQASIKGFYETSHFNSRQALDSIDLAVKLAERAIHETGCLRSNKTYENQNKLDILNQQNNHNLQINQKINTEKTHDYNLLTFKKIIMIAGSVGPYGASLCDQSEYSNIYLENVTQIFLKEWHRPRIVQLLDSGVDILACETIPCIKEALAIAELLKELSFAFKYKDIKAWFSFTIRSNLENNEENVARHMISSGEPFIKAYDILSIYPQVIAMGVNCVHPGLIEPLLCEIASHRLIVKNNYFDHESGKGVGKEVRSINALKMTNNFKTIKFSSPNCPALIVYPNRGEIWDPMNKKWRNADKNQLPLSGYLNKWVELGATYIGGCCRVYKEDIQQMRGVIDTYFKTCITNNSDM
ncbi:unnamed protein product [Gordionus sp. m RMFG-2023]|uniref:homocysteine S-methyltransferase-like n=1 Tax=Gordionus sp. m RMFG-2023 TaxID=3053472 RepID=UPI0030E24332